LSRTGAIKAGAAYVEIFADKSPLMRGLRAAENSVKQWGQSISSFGMKMIAAGSAILTPLVGAAKYFSNYGDSIAKMSKRTGVAVESLSALGYAAEQSGSNLEAVEKGIRKMQQNTLDAAMGVKTATEAFGMLGISVASFKDLKPEEQFRLLADRISGVADPSKRAAIAMKIFGRSGTQLLPLFEKGAAGIDELTNEAKKLGLVMSGEDAASAEELNDAMNRMWRTMKMAFANIGASIAPIITDLSNKIAVVVGKISNWIKANRGVANMALWLGIALVSAGASFVVFGKALLFTSKIFGAIRSSFAILKTGLMFLMSPIGLVIAAVTAITGAFLYFTGYGGQLLNWLGGCFKSLKEDATNAIGGISAAFAKGDLGLAARIGWLFVKTEWLKVKGWMLGWWGSIKLAMMEVWYALVYSLAVAWYATVHGIEIAFAETVGFISKYWTKGVALLKTAWAEAVGFFKTVWVGFKEWWGNTIDWVAKKLMRVWIWWKKLTDSSFDAASAEQQMNNSFAQDKQERTEKADADRARIDSETNAKLDKIQNEKDAALQEIEKKRAARRTQSKSEFCQV